MAAWMEGEEGQVGSTKHKDSRTSTEFGAERSQLKAAMDL